MPVNTNTTGLRCGRIVKRALAKPRASAVRVFIAGCLLVFSAAIATESGAINRQPSEYAVKAAFIYNFARFVEWPSSAFAQADDPIKICVLGDDPFGKVLDETIRGKSIAQHAFAIERIASAEEAGYADDCHIVFISRSETNRLGKVLTALQDKSVMTIGDMEDAAKRGAVMNFLLEGGRVRFAINADVAKRAGLNLSSQLIKLSTLVKSNDNTAP